MLKLVKIVDYLFGGEEDVYINPDNIIMITKPENSILTIWFASSYNCFEFRTKKDAIKNYNNIVKHFTIVE